MEDAARESREFSEHLGGDCGMAVRLSKEIEPRRFEQSPYETPGLRYLPWLWGKTRV
jgi:hypothetical protein